MATKSVTIRPAQKEDAHDIWHLLHNDCHNASMDDLIRNPEHFFVLLHGTKLLSVYHCSLHGREQHRSAIVHPLYPQKVLAKIITSVVEDIFLERQK